MGVESANYLFTPAPGRMGEAIAILLELGAEEEKREPGLTFFVLRGPEHWIDIQARERDATISFRVALCNPEGVLPVLQRALSTLQATVGGTIRDQYAKVVYRAFGTLEKESLVKDFHERRGSFRQRYGSFEAPISSSEVFGRLSPADKAK